MQNYERVPYDGNGAGPARGRRRVNQMGTVIEPLSLAGAVRYAHEVTGVPVLVTEHGMATDDDTHRAAFIEPSLAGLLDVMDEGVPVLGYCHWTLLDNFEWIFGYEPPARPARGRPGDVRADAEAERGRVRGDREGGRRRLTRLPPVVGGAAYCQAGEPPMSKEAALRAMREARYANRSAASAAAPNRLKVVKPGAQLPVAASCREPVGRSSVRPSLDERAHLHPRARARGQEPPLRLATSGSGADQPRLVRRDDGLHPVPDAQLRQDRGDVGLDRSRRHPEVGRDLGVALTLGEMDEDLALPRCQPQVGAGLDGRSGGPGSARPPRR